MSTRKSPNVVLVMTDDQGYGDLGCTGNPWISTPQIDAFSQQAVCCTDFHVSPLCTPARGGLMTGRRPVRNGAWATAWGRSILQRDELTMADVFQHNGYRTGLFGKWHLGDTYPYRPQDRGFQTVVAHKGGGVGQTPDFWGNSYFDDTYFHNGEAVEHTGYCTDIWFDEAMRFIEDHRDEPFFAYIATNAPHSPYLVADRYAEQYRGRPEIPEPEFYGMISNIDENFGRLQSKLEQLRLSDDTLLIFMTDNGSSGGCITDGRQYVAQGYNAGLRGKKASYYEGGHRVPFFVRWPGGGLVDREVDALLDHVDLLPTFVELCGLELPRPVSFDGMSVVKVLGSEEAALPQRCHFLQYRQSTTPPEKWDCAVLEGRWRLVHGDELYDVKADPGQVCDLAAQHPEQVARLRQAHEEWWGEVAPALGDYCPHVLGHDAENPTRLDAMDVMGDIAWDQPHIRAAQQSTGTWTVQVEQAGRYRFSLRRWPQELGLPMDAVPRGQADPGEVNSVELNQRHGADGQTRQLAPRWAELAIGGQVGKIEIEDGDVEAVVELDLPAFVGTLDAWFVDAAGQRCGAYYVYVERL
jgi:arylsulfatase A-like enzyme